MNGSNSFNICPRCANSNSLNAKYCSRCGAQLKVPTEAVVCHKCHTRNSALANFCRNCGATLKVGAQTKICPRCGREIGAEENICACGYSFVNMQQTEPRRADVSSTNKDRKRDKKRGKNRSVQETYANDGGEVQQSKSKRKRGGRGFAIFALLLIAVFAYAIISPATLRGPLGALDKGYFYNDVGIYNEKNPSSDKDVFVVEKTETVGGVEVKYQVNVKYYSGYSMLKDVFNLMFNVGALSEDMSNVAEINPSDLTIYDSYRLITSAQEALGAEQTSKFDFYKQTYGWGAIVILGLIALFLVTSLFHVLSCIVRLIAPKRSKRGNWLYLTLALLTTIAAALIICSQFCADKEGILLQLYNFFTPQMTVTEGKAMYYSVGYASAYIPAAYWILWLYSCIAKKAPKKEKKAKKNA